MLGITTFSPKGYNLYGKLLLESVIENWPGTLVCYVDEIPDLKHAKIVYKLLRNVHGHDQFIKYCSQNPVFSGRIEGGYSYTFDAVKFCHKVFAQIDALKKSYSTVDPISTKLFWIDGDCLLKKQIEQSFLESIFDGHTLAILSRPGFYTESGFIGFDTEGEKFKEFLDWYTKIYQKGLLFTLPGWHDCYALDHAINQSQVPYKDLVGNWKFGDKLEVIEDTVLGEYITHNKGGKKFERRERDPSISVGSVN